MSGVHVVERARVGEPAADGRERPRDAGGGPGGSVTSPPRYRGGFDAPTQQSTARRGNVSGSWTVRRIGQILLVVPRHPSARRPDASTRRDPPFRVRPPRPTGRRCRPGPAGRRDPAVHESGSRPGGTRHVPRGARLPAPPPGGRPAPAAGRRRPDRVVRVGRQPPPHPDGGRESRPTGEGGAREGRRAALEDARRPDGCDDGRRPGRPGGEPPHPVASGGGARPAVTRGALRFPVPRLAVVVPSGAFAGALHRRLPPPRRTLGPVAGRRLARLGTTGRPSALPVDQPARQEHRGHEDEKVQCRDDRAARPRLEEGVRDQRHDEEDDRRREEQPDEHSIHGVGGATCGRPYVRRGFLSGDPGRPGAGDRAANLVPGPQSSPTAVTGPPASSSPDSRSRSSARARICGLKMRSVPWANRIIP